MEVREFEPADLENLWHPVFPRGWAVDVTGAVWRGTQAGRRMFHGNDQWRGHCLRRIDQVLASGRQYVWAFVMVGLAGQWPEPDARYCTVVALPSYGRPAGNCR